MTSLRCVWCPDKLLPVQYTDKTWSTFITRISAITKEKRSQHKWVKVITRNYRLGQYLHGLPLRIATWLQSDRLTTNVLIIKRNDYKEFTSESPSLLIL